MHTRHAAATSTCATRSSDCRDRRRRCHRRCRDRSHGSHLGHGASDSHGWRQNQRATSRGSCNRAASARGAGHAAVRPARCPACGCCRHGNCISAWATHQRSSSSSNIRCRGRRRTAGSRGWPKQRRPIAALRMAGRRRSRRTGRRRQPPAAGAAQLQLSRSRSLIFHAGTGVRSSAAGRRANRVCGAVTVIRVGGRD